MVSQNIDVYVAPVNDLPTVGELDDLVFDEDFTDYLVVDLYELFNDIDGDVLFIRATSQNGLVDTYIDPDNNLILQSEADRYGIDVVTVEAHDYSGSSVWTSTSFMVTVNNIYDYPTFVGPLDGSPIMIDLDGETLDLSNFVDTHNENNTVPIAFQLVGDIPYYEVSNTEGALWSLDVYPIGHQWAYPDQECVLTLEGDTRDGDMVTETFITNYSYTRLLVII